MSPAAGSAKAVSVTGRHSGLPDYGSGRRCRKAYCSPIEGTGAGVVSAASAGKRLDLATPGRVRGQTGWGRSLCRILSALRPVTKLHRFYPPDSRSPIVVAGMIPTTVELDLPAAAGQRRARGRAPAAGQVTEEAFDNNIARLKACLTKYIRRIQRHVYGQGICGTSSLGEADSIQRSYLRCPDGVGFQQVSLRLTKLWSLITQPMMTGLYLILV